MEHRERELKFDVPSQWQLPDPKHLVPSGGSVERSTVSLEATYYDTGERDLLRSSVTLRRRRGGPDEGWHLKAPAGDARTEIAEPLGTGRTVPAPLRDATLGLRGGSAVAPIAVLRTERQISRVLDAAGSPRLEIVVDQVSASEIGVTGSGDGAVAGTVREWREAEIELVDGSEKELVRAARWIVEHGAEPSSSSSKVSRALGSPPAPTRDRRRLSGVVGRYLDEQYLAIVAGDIALRRGGDAIHATRVATRRYRSILRVFADVLDERRAVNLEQELAWFGAVLGDVRDREVLGTHLDAELADVPVELLLGPVTARIQSRLAAELGTARDALGVAMRSKRYFALLAELRDWREALPMQADPKAAAVEKFVARAQRKVRHRWRDVPRASSAKDGDGRDVALHRVRKAAKRARYTAELAEPVLGKPARRAVKELKRTQEVLGDRQDQVVAAEFLYRAGLAAATDGENAFTFGLLYERQIAGRA